MENNLINNPGGDAPEENNDSGDDWDETEELTEPFNCLFCTNQFKLVSDALKHCTSEHNFDLNVLKCKHNMDIYSYLKLINFIRKNQSNAQELMDCVSPIWLDDEYLKPVITDQWLMFDFEDWDEQLQDKLANFKVQNHKEDNKLQDLLNSYSQHLEQQQEVINRAMNDMEKMREITRNLVETNPSIQNDDNIKNLIEDESYFNTYAHFGIHYEMLNDKIRTETYRNAIVNNAEQFNNKLVLDVGCGTGILSLFCAKAGAKHVIGVDQSAVVYHAMDIVRENDLSDKIHLIRTPVEHVVIPQERVDIIISEWMGYFLLFEGMLDSLIVARDKYLAKDGVLLPNRCTINLLGIYDIERHNNVVNFWNDVYGFKMTCLQSEAVSEASIEIVDSDKIVTTVANILDLDLYKCTKTQVKHFEQSFDLTALKDCSLTAIVGYFDTYFTSLEYKCEFSTSPNCTPTHWKQTVFHLREPIPIKKDEIIKCHIKCVTALRSLSVTLKIGEMSQVYNVN